jgi:Holliday junction resolvase RusA-like endonuclease
VKSKEYGAWQKAAAQLLMLQHIPRFDEPVYVSLMIGEKGVSIAMDVDNTGKAYIDALKRAGVMKDDNRKWLRSARETWVPGFRGCVAIVGPAQDPPTAEALRLTVPIGIWKGMQ